MSNKMNCMNCQNAYFFAGGVAVALAGKLLFKSAGMRKACVSAMAQGMKVQKDVKVGFQNLKEDAEDLCYEARMEAEGEIDAEEAAAQAEQKNEI